VTATKKPFTIPTAVTDFVADSWQIRGSNPPSLRRGRKQDQNPRKGKDWQSVMDKGTALADSHFACGKLATQRLLHH